MYYILQELFYRHHILYNSNHFIIILYFSATLFSIPFGLMLAWPSPAYPHLLFPPTPIPITWDQSAMIAGFLMLGNIAGTPFSSWTFFGYKYGLIAALIISLAGWIVMSFANSIYWLLFSRFLVGFGNAFGNGQSGKYVQSFCEEKLAVTLGKFVYVHICVGVVLAVIVGGLFGYEKIASVAIAVIIVIAFIVLLLPQVEQEIVKVSEVSLTGTLRNATLRKPFIIFLSLIFFQQFTGAPATVVYNQIIFTYSKCPNPVYYSMVYALVYLFSNVFALFCGFSFNTKYALLMSSLSVSVILCFKAIVLYFNVNEEHWQSTSLVIMLLYIYFHSIGLGCAPLAFAQQIFPSECKKLVSQWYVMESSAFALIITKIFQTLFDQFALYVPFCLFAVCSLLCSLFTMIFVSDTLNLIKLR